MGNSIRWAYKVPYSSTKKAASHTIETLMMIAKVLMLCGVATVAAIYRSADLDSRVTKLEEHVDAIDDDILDEGSAKQQFWSWGRRSPSAPAPEPEPEPINPCACRGMNCRPLQCTCNFDGDCQSNNCNVNQGSNADCSIFARRTVKLREGNDWYRCCPLTAAPRLACLRTCPPRNFPGNEIVPLLVAFVAFAHPEPFKRCVCREERGGTAVSITLQCCRDASSIRLSS